MSKTDLHDDNDNESVDLSDLRSEDGIVLTLFWVLAGVVFLQFFTRYVLNNSYGWTEEIARYLLICVTFVGGVMATRKHSHIAVEFIYRWAARLAASVCTSHDRLGLHGVLCGHGLV
ncbi:MAG: TRAP transporter small permease [Roseinatronobacter sp.]